MSINWVMLAEGGGYTPLPGEQTLYKSPQRTTLTLQSNSRLPPSQAYSKHCKSGVVYLTNRRIIYLPHPATPSLSSFAVPILNVSDSRVTAPWFGANKWEALVQPVHGGGIPPHHAELELVMEFKEGGAFDFASTFERLKERLRQAVDVARESGMMGDEADGRAAGVNLNAVHLEDLPAYEESRSHTRVPDPHPAPPVQQQQQQQQQQQVPEDTGVVANGAADANTAAIPEPPSPRQQQQRSSPLSSPHQGTFQPPSEPPPGYEEVQRNSVVEALERQARSADIGEDTR